MSARFFPAIALAKPDHETRQEVLEDFGGLTAYLRKRRIKPAAERI
jgi:hypothetical protein